MMRYEEQPSIKEKEQPPIMVEILYYDNRSQVTLRNILGVDIQEYGVTIIRYINNHGDKCQVITGLNNVVIWREGIK